MMECRERPAETHGLVRMELASRPANRERFQLRSFRGLVTITHNTPEARR